MMLGGFKALSSCFDFTSGEGGGGGGGVDTA
jgi:hypothetical protein